MSCVFSDWPAVVGQARAPGKPASPRLDTGHARGAALIKPSRALLKGWRPSQEVAQKIAGGTPAVTLS